MNRKLAKELKAAGFPIRAYEIGHRFYPSASSAGWSDAARENGVTISRYEMQNQLQDIKDGYYCPKLADLIEACGTEFGRVFIEATLWTAEAKGPRKIRALGNSPEEAVARLWFALQGKKS